MTDPSAGFFTAKIASMVGGLFGGLAILTFIRPKTISEAFIRGGVSVGSALLLSNPLLKYFEMSTDWEHQAVAGFVIGFLAYSVLGMVANLLMKHKDSTITEFAGELKGSKNAKRRD